jgi:ATP-dependent exoDNAse (exonuclease V) beta subunit
MKPAPINPLDDQVAVSGQLIESALTPLYQPIEGFGIAESPDELESIQQVQSWRATQPDGQVSGKVLGLIVHKAIQRWLFPGDPALKALLESEAWRAGLATEITRREVINRATELLTRFRAHSLWNEVDSALERYAELPYSYLINDKVENRVIDLLYRDAGGWHIIDFKTDLIQSFAQKEHLIQVYAPQVRRYKAIVESKLGTSVSGKLCFLDDQGKVDLVDV